MQIDCGANKNNILYLKQTKTICELLNKKIKGILIIVTIIIIIVMKMIIDHCQSGENSGQWSCCPSQRADRPQGEPSLPAFILSTSLLFSYYTEHTGCFFSLGLPLNS